MFSINNLKSTIYEHRRIIITAVIALVLMIPVVYALALMINYQQQKSSQEQILGTAATKSPQPPTPTPTPSASPTPRVTRITPTPTPSPISSPNPSPSPSPSPASSSSDNTSTTSQPSPTPSPTPTPSPSPSPQASLIEVKVDYTPLSDRPTDTYSTTFSPNQTAWTVIQTAVGLSNLQYTDFGGDLGIFITGINGVVPAGNNFWLFKINGEAASVGVSSYIVQENDKMEFVISSF